MTSPASLWSRWLGRRMASPLIFAVLLLGGCNLLPPASSDPSRYFVLNGPTLQPGTTDAPVGTLRLGLKALSVPDYLRGREIVLRNGANEVELQDYNRWAEPLPQGLTRILKAHLLADRAVARVDLAPFPFDSEHDFDIAVDIIRCEGGLDGSRHVARFAAEIEVATAGNDPHVVERREFVAPEVEWNGTDYGKLAAALSDDVAALSRAIIAALPPK